MIVSLNSIDVTLTLWPLSLLEGTRWSCKHVLWNFTSCETQYSLPQGVDPCASGFCPFGGVSWIFKPALLRRQHGANPLRWHYSYIMFREWLCLPLTLTTYTHTSTVLNQVRRQNNVKYIGIEQDHKDILEVDIPSTRYYPLLIANLKEIQKNRIQTFGEAKMTSFSILTLSFSQISIAFIQVAFCLK